METKICTKCKQEYPATSEYFYNNNRNKDKLHNWCKKCCKEYDLNRSKNKEKILKEQELASKQLKICSKCQQIKQFSQFNSDNNKKYGLSSVCKECDKAAAKKYRELHPNYYINYYENKHKEEKEFKLKEQNALKAEGMKICSKCNKKLPYNMFGYGGSDFNWCNDCYKEYKKNYQELNKERKRLYDKQYRETHKEQGKLYRINNHEKIKLYRLNNADKIKEYNKQRYENNKIGKLMSNAMCYALKGSKSGQHWEDLVPYNLEQLKQHLESLFTPSMNWNNYGSYWEVDHIIPQNLFKFESYTDREFQICWSLNNLRPLEKYLNRQRPKDGSDVSDDIRNKIMKG